MLVKEMIEILKTLDPEKTVLLADDEYGPSTINEITEESGFRDDGPKVDSARTVWIHYGWLYIGGK